jgi:enoyl-CoA hydratase/carnithine racemase
VPRAIYCDCGLICRGDSDDELLAAAERHLREEHPALAGRVSPADLLAMSVEVDAPNVPAEAPPGDSPVAVSRDAGVATVVINRPERRNALSLAVIRSLAGVLQDLGRDPGVRAIVLAGAGSAFCSGHDLTEMRGMAESEARILFEADEMLMSGLRALGRPTVARVQGPASGAGCHIVAACDLAVAAPGATFAVPGPVLGLPGATAMVEVARLIGRRRAMHMVLTGSAVTAETALAWGLVNAVVPAPELGAAAQATAVAASRGAPAAVTAAKRALDEASLADARRAATEVSWRAVGSAEAQEGIAAFLDRRPPSWPASAG